MSELEQAFEKAFPKIYERPALHPYKDDIKEIVLNTVREFHVILNDEP